MHASLRRLRSLVHMVAASGSGGGSSSTSSSARRSVSSIAGSTAPWPLRSRGPGPSPLDGFVEHQASLPRIPIPSLDMTLPRLLEVVEPLVTPDVMEAFRREVAAFSETDGPRLHEELVKLDATLTHTSFVTDWWNHSYFTGRYPVVNNANPFLRFPRSPLGPDHPVSQAQLAARMAHGASRTLLALYSNTYDPDIEGGMPMCSAQFGDILGSCRIPHRGADTLSTITSRNKDRLPTHVVVSRGGKFFSVKVLDDLPGTPGKLGVVPVDDLVKVFEDLLAQPIDPSPSVGLFTTLDRDTWADIRSGLLEASPYNRATLAAIEESLFVLSMEDWSPATEQEQARMLLNSDGHGSGWYDKFTVLIGSGGLTSGANFEHSATDGHAFRRIVHEMYFSSDGLDTGSPPLPPTPPAVAPSPAETLTWHLTPDLESALQRAASDFKASCANLDLSVLTVPELDKETIKSFKMSPDGFVQAAFQLAFRRAHPDHPTMPSVYESCSMRHMLAGRTETIRPVTAQSTHLTSMFSSPVFSTEEKVAALRESAAAHVDRCRQAQRGKGIDRHLFALMCLAQELDGDVPALFKHPAMSALSTIDLSTSFIGGKGTTMIGFAPVTERGYGLGYLIEKDHLKFTITAYKRCSDGSSSGRSVKKFEAALHQSLMDMRALFMSE